MVGKYQFNRINVGGEGSRVTLERNNKYGFLPYDDRLSLDSIQSLEVMFIRLFTKIAFLGSAVDDSDVVDVEVPKTVTFYIPLGLMQEQGKGTAISLLPFQCVFANAGGADMYTKPNKSHKIDLFDKLSSNESMKNLNSEIEGIALAGMDVEVYAKTGSIAEGYEFRCFDKCVLDYSGLASEELKPMEGFNDTATSYSVYSLVDMSGDLEDFTVSKRDSSIYAGHSKLYFSELFDSILGSDADLQPYIYRDRMAIGHLVVTVSLMSLTKEGKEDRLPFKNKGIENLIGVMNGNGDTLSLSCTTQVFLDKKS